MELPEQLAIDRLVHHSWHKAPTHGTYTAVYDGRPAVAKYGGPQLVHEAQVLQAVHDEGVPAFIDYRADEELGVLVMQCLPGTPLTEYIGLDREWHSEPLDTSEAVRIVDGLAQRFSAVHKEGFLYRDLNLNHILVSKTIGLVDHEWCASLAADGSRCSSGRYNRMPGCGRKRSATSVSGSVAWARSRTLLSGLQGFGAVC